MKVVQEGAIAPLINLLKSTDNDVLENVAGTLRNITETGLCWTCWNSNPKMPTRRE